jgi:hypothetical protein
VKKTSTEGAVSYHVINGQHRIRAALKLLEEVPTYDWDKCWPCLVYENLTPYQEAILISVNNATDSLKNSIALSCNILRNVVFPMAEEEYSRFTSANAYQIVFAAESQIRESTAAQGSIYKQIAIFPKLTAFIHPGLTEDNAQALREGDLDGNLLSMPYLTYLKTNIK